MIKRVILKCIACDKPVGYIEDAVQMSDTYIEIAPNGTMRIDGDMTIGNTIYFNHVECRDKIPESKKELRITQLHPATVTFGVPTPHDYVDGEDGYTSIW
jgi:hypothetical protein